MLSAGAFKLPGSVRGCLNFCARARSLCKKQRGAPAPPSLKGAGYHMYENITGIFDSHSHYDDPAFCPGETGEAGRFRPCACGASGDGPAEVLKSVAGKGVAYVMTCGTSVESSARSLDIASSLEHVYCAAGIHPECAEECPSDYMDRLLPILSHSKTLAVGEIGLDYSYPVPREPQLRIFEEQVLLANRLSLPVIVHDREAHADTFDILMRHRPRGVIHCYSGSLEMAKEYVKAGFFLGITGIVTFKNARKVRELAEWIPEDRLLIETDAPYLAPEPFRGCRNDSSLLFRVAESIAEIRGCTPREVADFTRENARALFGVKE